MRTLRAIPFIMFIMAVCAAVLAQNRNTAYFPCADQQRGLSHVEGPVLASPDGQWQAYVRAEADMRKPGDAQGLLQHHVALRESIGRRHFRIRVCEEARAPSAGQWIEADRMVAQGPRASSRADMLAIRVRLWRSFAVPVRCRWGTRMGDNFAGAALNTTVASLPSHARATRERNRALRAVLQP